MLRDMKTLEDFGPTGRSTGLHQRTMKTIRATVEQVKTLSDGAARQAGEGDTGCKTDDGTPMPPEQVISEAQHSIETCDVVLGQLDKMEGK